MALINAGDKCLLRIWALGLILLPAAEESHSACFWWLCQSRDVLKEQKAKWERRDARA